jgi:mono/diheme cytochrome c family protein
MTKVKKSSIMEGIKTAKLILIAIAAAAFTLGGCGQTPSIVNTTPSVANSSSPSSPAAKSTSPEAAANDGKELYSSKCMICHKDTGKGGKVTVEGKILHPADLTSAKMKSRDDDKLAQMIGEGDPDEGMPAFKTKLTDEQIKAIVQYVRTLQ